jgi:murein DD-endopeptidase MepM/ murein hydrolase activator NlpD
MSAWALGLTAGLGLVSVYSINRWKRAQAQQYFDEGGTLPEPGKYNPNSTWEPDYGDVQEFEPAPHPFEHGVAYFLVREGRFVRSFDMNRNPPHWGLDISAPLGTPVYCAKNGDVLGVREISGYGLCVLVTHGNQSTMYAHLNQAIVSPGQGLRGGDIIGEVGRSTVEPDQVQVGWQQAMGSHLHFEVHNTPEPILMRTQRRVEPTAWLSRHSIGQYGRRW